MDVPEPALRIDADLGAIEASLPRVCHDLAALGIDVAIPPDVPKLIATVRARVASGSIDPATARRLVIDRMLHVANRALEQKGDARRLTRLSMIDGAIARGTPVLLITPVERKALLASGRVVLGPSPRDRLMQLASLPFAFLSAALGVMAYRTEDMRYAIAAVMAYATWLVMRWWNQMRSASIALPRPRR